ncbi:MAG: hypothetical protein QOD38_810 [Acidimicrobiaceae bacterium]
MSTGLRERKKEKTREALVDSALRQFAERGFDHVTVEDIAGACDVSPRTFFRYFASKEDVLFADGDGFRAQLLESLAEQDPKVSAFAALASAIRMVAGHYAEQPERLRIRHRIVNSTPSLRTRAVERHHDWDSTVIDQLRASGRAEDLSDLDLRLIVGAMMTALRVAMDAWIAGDSADELEHLLDSLFERLRGGLDR